MKKKVKASVTLTTVLVTSTILLLIGLSYIAQAMDLAYTSKASTNYELNTMRARSCLEEGLNKLKNNPAYLGNATVPYIDGSCTVTIATDPNNNSSIRLLTIVASVNEYYYATSKLVNLSTQPFTVTNP